MSLHTRDYPVEAYAAGIEIQNNGFIFHSLPQGKRGKHDFFFSFENDSLWPNESPFAFFFPPSFLHSRKKNPIIAKSLVAEINTSSSFY